LATPAGAIGAEFAGDEVRVDMTQPRDLRPSLSIKTKAGQRIVHHVDTGVPHVVLFVDSLEKDLDVRNLGAELRWHEAFRPRGANANFAQRMGPNRFKVRTYERGVEDETLACGTGVVATALTAAVSMGVESPVEVEVRSGSVLTVSFQRGNNNDCDFKDVRLLGPAVFTFKGEINV
jgi:diaminopimelate epimerase